MWPPSHAYVTCDIIFCLLCLCPNKEKEKETQNKIKESRIKLSLSFTTLTNKALSTIKSMKILENSIWDLLSEHKQLLYRIYIISITLYRFQLWYFKNALVHQSLNKLNKIQRRAVLWIINTFQVAPSCEVEVIAELILIQFYLNKINRQHHFHVLSLSK